jgi:hypothetical protein
MNLIFYFSLHNIINCDIFHQLSLQFRILLYAICERGDSVQKIEIDFENRMITLPNFYSKYADAFVYYQVEEETDNETGNENYIFSFHIFKEDAKMNLPILMSRITEKGNLVAPIDLINVYKLYNEELYFMNNGFSDFIITTQKSEKGLTIKDSEYLLSLFGTT